MSPYRYNCRLTSPFCSVTIATSPLVSASILFSFVVNLTDVLAVLRSVVYDISQMMYVSVCKEFNKLLIMGEDSPHVTVPCITTF